MSLQLLTCISLNHSLHQAPPVDVSTLELAYQKCSDIAKYPLFRPMGSGDGCTIEKNSMFQRQAESKKQSDFFLLALA